MTVKLEETVKIGAREIGRGGPTYVIAEIGSNHGGDLERTLKLVAACAEAGADAAKLQSWTVAGLQNCKDVTPEGLVDSKSWPVLERYRLPDDWHPRLSAHCRKSGLAFLSTPFDLGRARLLRSLDVPAIQIASGDLTYDELLEEVGSYGLPVLLSTGMANLGEIEHALTALGSAAKRTVLLHCVGAYPPEPEDANLKALVALQQAFGLPVGLSDHFPGHAMAVAAVALGACVIEKHVTFARTDGHPDSPFALEIPELAELVRTLRTIERALGDGRKRCMPSESGGLIGGRRCVFAARDLPAGRALARDDLAVVRPAIGEIAPAQLRSVVGRKLRNPLSKGVPLSWKDLG